MPHAALEICKITSPHLKSKKLSFPDNKMEKNVVFALMYLKIS